MPELAQRLPFVGIQSVRIDRNSLSDSLNTMRPFGTYEPNTIHNRIERCVSRDAYRSIRFFSTVPPVRLLDQVSQWQRFKGIVGCSAVHEAFGTMHGPIDRFSDLTYGLRYATIGILANFLEDGSAHGSFAMDTDDAINTARSCLDELLGRDYHTAEAYHLDFAWSEWFIGEQYDRTYLLGQRSAWWLLAFTDTD